MKHKSDFLAKIGDILSKEKVRLENSLNSIKAQDPYANPERLNDNAASDTEASEESSHERVEALVKEVAADIIEIDDALLRIQKGIYGKCLQCRKLISSARLTINPAARFCLVCVKKHEPV